MFSRAIIRPPSENFAAGLTTSELGLPHFETALAQHEAYCDALEKCGLELVRLPPDARHPDATFVEDTAIVTTKGAIITRPGAPIRRGETESIAEVLSEFFTQLHPIRAESAAGPTVDGGDVCQAGNHFFIGISQRTNVSGAQQLSGILATLGYASTYVDIRETHDLLHLKSGIAYLGDDHMVLVEALANRKEFSGYSRILVKPDEVYAANCVLVNDFLLIAAGFPNLERELLSRGYKTIALQMSEFQKMDGGLSCLSLRF